MNYYEFVFKIIYEVNFLPKIIKNLDKKIYKTALSLFSTRGYEQVTMKLIADETGVAVGTLYNYYTNKMNLFINVFKEYLNQISELLHEIIENEGDLKGCITTLYDKITEINGFSEEIIKSTIINKNEDIISIIKEEFIQKMKTVMNTYKKRRGTYNTTEKQEERILRLLLLAIIDFAREYPEEREENINFIIILLDRIAGA